MADEWSSSLDVHLDWTPGTGRKGLAKAVRAAIRDGRWRPGAVVPSTRALAHDLGVARGTVTRVYSDLAAEGYLQSSQGAPTRVATAGAEALSQPRPTSAREPVMRWNLLPGRPDSALFPRDVWLAATKRVLQHTHNETFGYGEPRGSSVLRATLSAYLARSRGVLADPARIVVCAGFSHAMTVLGHALQQVGIGEMAFEDPSFHRFRDLAAAAGQRITTVPVDGDGMRVAELTSPAVVVTPAHQSPIGVTLAPDRRTALTRTGAVIVEDDYDGEFRYDRQQVGALQALAPERVIYAGTASKTLAPSLRLGWLVLPRSLVDPVIAALASSGAQPPLPTQLVLADMISTGAYDRHVRRCRIEYRSRRDRLAAALPPHLIPQGISAGLHLMVPLSEDAEAQVPAVARRHSLDIATVAPMVVQRKQHGLIVGYGAPSKNAFTGALEALLAVLHELRG
ncbi:PLP-dependent aminotransferase family protein [Kibdelosporangium phytohabitans]|uniref:GntR family transcriptional regulator n=1 Tax=Kibdelosporangium phytohabitans TaxID=860235 RepID=A0A0N7F4G3_9PSEU|nr:PLP-dependent aminotransferase family protein [Kibdelosporangium phytohabitans]ALG11351.1 GntR family transcriptional regulator [Kibdelosporangium phytohabitans]MBE1462670.1 GntR family transcriptional regulator/MocR family aminotransferase [Kibdelosporangium phytohabitans]